MTILCKLGWIWKRIILYSKLEWITKKAKNNWKAQNNRVATIDHASAGWGVCVRLNHKGLSSLLTETGPLSGRSITVQVSVLTMLYNNAPCLKINCTYSQTPAVCSASNTLKLYFSSWRSSVAFVIHLNLQFIDTRSNTQTNNYSKFNCFKANCMVYNIATVCNTGYWTDVSLNIYNIPYIIYW